MPGAARDRARSGSAAGAGCAARRRCAPRPSVLCRARSRARCCVWRSRASRRACGARGGTCRGIAPVSEHPLSALAGTPRLAGDGTNPVDERQELGHVVTVPAGQGDRERDPARVGDQVMLGARAGTVNRRGAGVEPPKSARIWLPSTTDVDQSIRPAAFNRRSSSWCSRSHTPAACQAASLRCAVAGEQPISAGKCRHVIPVNNTNTIALKHTRSSTRGRPPRGSGGCSGSNSSTASHSSSRTPQTEPATEHLPHRGYVTQKRFAPQRPKPPPRSIETAS